MSSFINVKDSSGNWVSIPVLTGNTGATPNISVKATTLAVGAAATVTRSGTNENPVFTFGLPVSDVNSVLSSYAKLSGATFTGAVKATTFQATSDERLKSDIESYSADLSSLGSYKYTLNADNKKHIGLIAQQVAQAVPEAVEQDEQGFYSVDYNAIVALLVDKVNQLEARIKQLETN